MKQKVIAEFKYNLAECEVLTLAKLYICKKAKGVKMPPFPKFVEQFLVKAVYKKIQTINRKCHFDDPIDLEIVKKEVENAKTQTRP